MSGGNTFQLGGIMRYLLVISLLLWCGAASASQEVMIQVKFKEMVNVNGMQIEYSDALYFKPEEYSAKTQADIDAVKAVRVANFKEAVLNPVKPKELSKEEIQAQLTSIEEQKVTLESQKVELEAKLTAISANEEPLEEPIEEVKP